MKGQGEKLSRKQEVAIAALLTSPTTSEPRRAGLSDVTLVLASVHGAPVDPKVLGSHLDGVGVRDVGRRRVGYRGLHA